jgi:hypothetical protein
MNDAAPALEAIEPEEAALGPESAGAVESAASAEAPRAPVPLGAWLVTAFITLAPLAHLAALAAGVRVLNFGNRNWWDTFVYLVVAPIVGLLLIKRHERARFSAYVFLSTETVRGIKVHSWPLIAIAVGAILYFQLPAVRAAYPRIDAGQVRKRLRSYVRRAG